MGYTESLLSDKERLVFVTHQHWMTLARSALENLLIALVIVVAAAAISVWMLPDSPVPFLLLILLLLPAARFVLHYLVWENRQYIITNRRVIQVDGIINKNVTDSSLEKVNDVKMSQSVLGRMLDYGDLEILTASELAPNLFRRIASPIKFKTAMLNQKEAMGTGEDIPTAPVGGPAKPDVPALLANLDILRKQGIITEDEFERKKQELLARI